MIERDQFIEGRSAKDDLLAVSGPQPRASRGGWSLGWRGLACRIGRCLEERGLFEARRLGIVWVFHEEIIAVGSSLDNTFEIIGDSFTGSQSSPACLRTLLPGRCDLPQYRADLLPVIRLQVAQVSSHAALGQGRQLMKADS